jgi:hypothetical protein
MESDLHGTRVVFFGRFVSVLRIYAAFLAGASRMRWRRFLPANASGGIVWSGIYTTAAYFAGNTLRRESGTIDVILGIAAVAAIVDGVHANDLAVALGLDDAHSPTRGSSLTATPSTPSSRDAWVTQDFMPIASNS